MALKFTAAESKRLAGLAEKLAELKLKLEDAISVFNETTATARAELDTVLEKYNECANEAYAVLEDIKSEAEEQYEEKSEKWQESEKGEAVSKWIESIDEAMTVLETPTEIDELQELDIESVASADLTDLLNELPSKPEE